MKSSAFKTIETNTKSPVLILDKVGVIGEALGQEFSKDFQVILVSKRLPLKRNEKIYYIPFKTKIPKVPNALYSKIFIIDDGEKVTRESAQSFVERARQTNSSIYFIGSVRNIDIAHADEISTSYQKAKVLIFGDLFDNEMFLDKSSSISRFIFQTRKNKKLYVEDDGLNLNYPMLFKDTIKLIIKATFIDVPQKVILLFNQHPITDLSLAHTFQKIDPDISVDFVNGEVSKKLYFPRGAQFALARYDLKKKILELDLNKENREEIKINKKRRGVGGKYIKAFGLFLAACLFLFLLPLIATSAYSFLGIRQIEGARVSAEKGDFQEALQKSKNAQTFFSVAKRMSKPLEVQANLIGLGQAENRLNSKIEIGENLSIATHDLFSAAILLQNIYTGKSKDVDKDFSDASSNFKNAYSVIQKTRAQGQIPAGINQRLDNIGPLIELFSNSSEVLPGVMGLGVAQNYLILFQNSKELRPGGGVVDAVGVLSVENGRIKKFEVFDTSYFDSQLKNHVEPPYAIRRYLPSKDLYLRDSNFDPDFVNNSISAATLYKLQTKNDIDGVIGVNFNFVKDLLKVLGPVSVEDYGKVNSESVDQLALGKTNESMPALLRGIQEKIGESNNPKLISFAEVIGKGISNKDILIAVKDEDAQNIFTANKLSGDLVDSRKQDTLNDYFGISEANLGKNKINDFISRSVSRKLIVADTGDINSVATISYKNNAPKGAGDYKNYVQLILPRGAKIEEVSVGGKVVNTIPAITDYLTYERRGYVAPQSFEIEQRIEENKTVFGFLLLVPPEAVKTIKITYSLPFRLAKATKPVDYSLYIYKQPGVDPYSFEQAFEAPPGFNMLPTALSVEIKKDQEFNFSITQR